MWYMAENWATATSRPIEWEALKVILWGHCTNAVVGVQADVHRELTTLEQSLGKLEADSRTTPVGWHAITNARERHAQLITQLRCYDFRTYQPKFHSEGETSGHLLSWLLHGAHHIGPIIILCQTPTHMVTSQLDIHATFTSYYKSQYDPPPIDKTDATQAFLSDMVFPTVDQLAREEQQLSLSEQELMASIGGSAMGKTPGLDVLPA
ncbi:hypothetical protein NDU88_001775 [Pleurodeles waltl]|uniref:Uncharacterized protein n=1 Tax=Pleurodeles waltl TaxID=8319 RepID=A0AAV7QB31_PLEWA|nr:hypothetical protein NDU88_001775 [Pleurodeles waltl]